MDEAEAEAFLKRQDAAAMRFILGYESAIDAGNTARALNGREAEPGDEDDAREAREAEKLREGAA